jgi:hypothetical protein
VIILIFRHGEDLEIATPRKAISGRATGNSQSIAISPNFSVISLKQEVVMKKEKLTKAEIKALAYYEIYEYSLARA